MAGKLRVFVASTMKDLRNERAEVIQRLKQFNFEPVIAEDWLPGGTNVWERIEKEVGRSDVFVLLIGDTYGWTPGEGPQSEKGLSVTHLEFQQARSLRLPILPFSRRLGTADQTSNDWQKREQFRQEVEAWDSYVRGEFDLATDLANSVGSALVALLSDSFMRKAMAERSAAVAQTTARVPQAPAREPVPPPAALVAASSAGSVALFTGSGISIPAGFPSAAAFAERLRTELRKSDPDYAASVAAAGFAGAGSDFVLLFGRPELERVVVELLEPPQGATPTRSHELAVRMFDVIVTSNYDDLFARAAEAAGTGHVIVDDEAGAKRWLHERSPAQIILKLHGSVSKPATLMLTEEDLQSFLEDRHHIVSLARCLIAEHDVLLIGTSLRDPSIVPLFAELPPDRRHWFVGDRIHEAMRRRLEHKGISPIVSESEGFLQRLWRSVAQSPGTGPPTGQS